MPLQVFTAKDPVRAGWWQCLEGADNAACEVARGVADPTAFCALPRDSWGWTKESWSVVSEFNLICGRSILSQLANSAFFFGTRVCLAQLSAPTVAIRGKGVCLHCKAHGMHALLIDGSL
jgi:hypothetical protein